MLASLAGISIEDRR